MINPVLMIVYNNLALTQAAVASVLEQDVDNLRIVILDNGSTDGTKQWLKSLAPKGNNYTITTEFYSENQSPIKLGNLWMPTIYSWGAEYILGVPNDVVLPPNLYRSLLKWPRGFVTATPSKVNPPAIIQNPSAVSEHTPMAVLLVRRWAYDAIMSKDGFFWDEGYFHYASDVDLSLRMAACGIRGAQLNVQYWHYESASYRLSSPEIARHTCQQADIDREYFVKKFGFSVDSPEYAERCGDVNFVA